MDPSCQPGPWAAHQPPAAQWPPPGRQGRAVAAASAGMHSISTALTQSPTACVSATEGMHSLLYGAVCTCPHYPTLGCCTVLYLLNVSKHRCCPERLHQSHACRPCTVILCHLSSGLLCFASGLEFWLPALLRRLAATHLESIWSALKLMPDR